MLSEWWLVRVRWALEAFAAVVVVVATAWRRGISA